MPRTKGATTEPVSTRLPVTLKRQFEEKATANGQKPSHRLHQLILADLAADQPATGDTVLGVAQPSIVQQIVDAAPVADPPDIKHRHTPGEVLEEKHENGDRLVRYQCADPDCGATLSWRKAPA